MNIFTNWIKPKALNPAQRIRKGEKVSVEEICEYIKNTYPAAEQDKFFADIQLSVYPVLVQKLLEFKDSGEISESDFFNHLREKTKEINELLNDKNNETKIS